MYWSIEWPGIVRVRAGPSPAAVANIEEPRSSHHCKKHAKEANPGRRIEPAANLASLPRYRPLQGMITKSQIESISGGRPASGILIVNILVLSSQ